MNDLTKGEVVEMAREAGFSQDWQFAVPPATLSNFAALCRAPLVAENAALKQAHEINADTLNTMQVEIDDWKARAEAAEAELARVRAVEPAGYFVPEGWDALGRVTDWAQVVKNQGTPLYATPPQPAVQEPVAWNHGCNALCADIDLWIDRCPHCGMPRPAAPAPQEPTSAVPVVRKMVEALEKHHAEATRYSTAKNRANATCAEFKTSPLSELAEQGYMLSLGKETVAAITAGQQYLKENGK